MSELNKEHHAPAFSQTRFQVTAALFVLTFSVLIVRLYFLQVVHEDRYTEKSRQNFVQTRRIPHTRGFIYDQAGRILVDNRPSHDVYMTVAFLPDSTRAVRSVGAPLGLDKEAQQALDKDILERAKAERGTPIVLAERLGAARCKDVERVVRAKELTGVEVAWWSEDDADGCKVSVLPLTFPSRSAVFHRVRELAGIDREVMDEAATIGLRKARGLGKFKPTRLLEDVGYAAHARLHHAASLGELPGIHLEDSTRRQYLEGDHAAHILGFMNELSPGEYKARKADGYHLGDRIGRRGVEQAFEDVLRGTDGVSRVVVDAKGRTQGDRAALELLGDSRRTEPVGGQSLVLSIDGEMQRAAEDAFRGRAGSVVALEAHTGFVLALASLPGYDPNAVTGVHAARVRRELNKNEYRPWRNKAIQDHYSPGSTFKAITAVAALREKLVTPAQHIHCPGYYRLGRARWRCYNRGGHGPIALVRALQFSCDTYFYSLGHQMGADKHAATGRLFGLGSRTGIGVDREIPGIMPDEGYYKKRFGHYSPGFVVNNSIGQGDVNVTPLQLAVAYAAIGNGGVVYQPQVVREIKDGRGEVIEKKSPVIKSELKSERETLKLVREALSHVTEPGGTAYGLNWRRDQEEVSKWLRESGVTIGGKTGTAQVVRLSKSVAHVDPKDVDYWQRDHAWFVGLIPAWNPEVVVVTMTEHGGFGGSTSAPVVAAVAQVYWERVRGKGRYQLTGDDTQHDIHRLPTELA